MRDKRAKTLRGLTWKHDRGLAPLLATAAHFCGTHPEVKIEWETRSLQDFGEGSIQTAVEHYDLVVIDHPYMGVVAREKCFLPLDDYFAVNELQELSQDSLGLSYPSYCFDGHQWAFPIDAAAQVAGYRADILETNGFNAPQTWEEVAELAKVRRGFVTPALSPLDSLMCFFTMCANLGEPPFAQKDQVVSGNIGEQVLERLRILAEHSAEGALSANPIAIWERMSSSDDIAYCPLAFGYSNYARNRYRSKLISFCCIPSSGHGPIGATLGGAGLAISQNCKHSDLALKYAFWLAGEECQRTLYVESGGQPASKSAWQGPHANKITNDYFAATLSVLENAWLRPRFAGFEDFQIQAAGTLSRFLKSDKSWRETLSRLDDLYANAVAANEKMGTAQCDTKARVG